MNVPSQVAEAIANARRLVFASHIPMDGDGLGCGIALVRALRSQKELCALVTEADLPRAAAHLGVSSADVVDLRKEPLPSFDLLVGLDAGSRERLGRAWAERPEGSRVLNIDHHISNDGYGDVNWVDPTCAATGEQVFMLLRALGGKIDEVIAQALLVSLVTDTGRFSYSNTTPRTLEIAADLLRYGADPDALSRDLYRSVPAPVLELQARAAKEIRYHANGTLATLSLPLDFASDLSVSTEDIKDLVDVVIGVQGVVVAALVRDLARGGSKVSLRSKSDGADVAAFASARGGGGHVRASGFPSPGDAATTADEILPDLLALAKGGAA